MKNSKLVVTIVIMASLAFVGCTTPPKSGGSTSTTSSTTIPTGPVQLIVAGDSMTAMPVSYGGASSTWAGLLPYPVANTAQGGAAFTYINAGITEIGDKLMAYVSNNGCNAPVVVVGATNDFRVGVTADEVQTSVESLASRLSQAGCTSLWVTTVPAPSWAVANGTVWNTERYNERFEWNLRLKSSQVNLAGGHVADCSSLLEGADGFTAPQYALSSDALHINQDGQYVLRDCIQQSLNSMN